MVEVLKFKLEFPKKRDIDSLYDYLFELVEVLETTLSKLEGKSNTKSIDNKEEM